MRQLAITALFWAIILVSITLWARCERDKCTVWSNRDGRMACVEYKGRE